MNPIENAWAELQKSVSKEIREDGRPDSREELWGCINNSWEELEESDIVENLRMRWTECDQLLKIMEIWLNINKTKKIQFKNRLLHLI